MFKNFRCFDKENMDTNSMEFPEALPMNNSFCEQKPIYEPMQERVCHRQFIHEVPHVCPINTRIINHHIYRHTFTPCYTCCEENEVCNVYDGCSSQF